MKYKIIFYTTTLIIALVIQPIFKFIIEARDCKADLKLFEQKEIKNINQIKQTKTYVKKTQKQIIDNPDINFRRQLLDQIKDSE